MLVNRAIPEGERNAQERNTWTFSQAAEAALNHLSEDHKILRIIGPSGFGKSRFAYELFNKKNLISERIYTAALIYADLSIVGDEAAKIALEIADAAWPTILVVDDCPDEIHSILASIAQRVGSRLRLVTANVETRMQPAKDTLVISLEPAPDKLIDGIAKSIAPKLSDADGRFIQQVSNGFPRMAVLAAQQGGKRREAIASIEQVIERIIWGKRTRDERVQKALEVLSLFDWLGLSGRVKEQASYIARELGGTSEDIFVEDLKSLIPRGIIVQRGDFIQVQPIPLAARLAAHRLSLLSEGKLVSFFASAPLELRLSLLRRFRWLDTSAAAKAFAMQILQENCLGNLSALNSGFGSEAVDCLVHVDPDAVMRTFDRVLGSLSLDQLRGIKEGRRHIVWVLEKLAFRKATFSQAATLLRRLGAAETEERIGNNASGIFKQLYQIYLSGTEASPDERVQSLDEGFRSVESAEHVLCVEALGRMLQSSHFTRMGGGEEIGSGERLQDWAPKTNVEIWNFYRHAMTRLVNIGVREGEFAQQARSFLGSNVRGLIGVGIFEDVKEMVERISSHVGLWAKAIQGVNHWLYFDRRKAPREYANKVRAFFDQLMPVDPVELVELYTSGWQTDFYDPDTDYKTDGQTNHDFEYAIRKACAFAEIIAQDPIMLDRALNRLVTSNAKTIFPFAKRLGELASDPVALFATAIKIAEAQSKPANKGFFGGLIAGTDQNNPEKARVCIRAALQSPKLKNDAISMIGSGALQPDDLRLVISLLQSGDVEPRQCATLSYGRGLDHLSPKQIMPLLDELGHRGGEGLWTVLDIISMYIHGGKPLPKLFIPKLKSTLIADDLFDDVVRHSTGGHDYEQMVKVLVKNGKTDGKFAIALMRQLLSICQPQKTEGFFELDRPIRSVIGLLLPMYPKEVWREISKVITSTNAIVRDYAQILLFERNHDSYLDPGLLHDLPSDIYLDWVRKAPSSRAEFIINWLPITIARSDGTTTWSQELEAYVSEFGNHAGVLVALASRMVPGTFYGSIAQYLEPFLPLLEPWTQRHPLPVVRRWAQDRIASINAQIETSRKEDDERGAGIY